MKSDDKAGLYITVIFHLMVIIVLLVSQISSALKRENTFVLDFSKQERVEKEQAERNLKDSPRERHKWDRAYKVLKAHEAAGTQADELTVYTASRMEPRRRPQQ